MGRKQKYEEVQGWWVYSIQVPSINKYYIGVSGAKKCCQRWNKLTYIGSSLEPYLDEWEDMKKTVLIDGLTKQESFIHEGEIIEALSMNNLCINSNRSGMVTEDVNAYHREYYENNTEYKEYQKQWKENNKKQIKQYQKQWQIDNREKWNEYQREYQRQQRLKKKLQNQQLN